MCTTKSIAGIVQINVSPCTANCQPEIDFENLTPLPNNCMHTTWNRRYFSFSSSFGARHGRVFSYFVRQVTHCHFVREIWHFYRLSFMRANVCTLMCLFCEFIKDVSSYSLLWILMRFLLVHFFVQIQKDLSFRSCIPKISMVSTMYF